ncbi:guanylate-binding protein 3-like, partial [Mustelus asterias]
FVTELARRIQVNSQSNVTQERSFVQFFPDFVWTLRDLTLDLEIDGVPVTPDQYLENSLRLIAGESDRNTDYNALRRCIRDYFPSRRCFAFVCPAARADLRNLQELPDDRLDPEFVEEFRRFSEYINGNGKVKRVPGGYQVTGKMLSQLVESYVAAIARGKLPCVESGVAVMVDKENQDAMKAAVGYYDQKLSAALELPPHIVYRLSDLFTFYHNEAIRIFMDHSLMDNHGKYIGKLAEDLQSRYKSVISEIERVSRSHCKEVLDNLQGLFLGRLDTGEYLKPGGSSALDDDLEEVVEDYTRRTSEEVKGVEVLAQFLKTVQPRLAKVRKVHSVSQEKVEHESVLRKQLAKAAEERKALEERGAADERVRAEEVVRLAKRRYEEEKEREVDEHTRVINHKRAEATRYRAEGSREDWKKNEEDSRYYEDQRGKARSRSFWVQCQEFLYRLYSWLFQ